MATAVELPKSGNTVEECVISRWVKREGDIVSIGDVVAEVETDKATFEITAPVAGTLLATFFPEGALVPVFTTVCVIGEPGERVEVFRPAGADTRVRPYEPIDLGADTQVRPYTVGVGADQRVGPAAGTPPWSPRARKFAAAANVPLTAIAGSGPGGRVLERDVRAALKSAPEPTLVERPAVPRDLGGQQRPTSPSTAQFTLHRSADARRLVALRGGLKERARMGRSPDVTIGALVAFCAVRALLEAPELNAEFVEGAVGRHRAVHLGFACDTPHGVLLPVVRNAHDLSLGTLARRMSDLAARAADRTVSDDHLSGATFTISNAGALGVEWFTPPIGAPRVASLGVGAIHVRPVRTDSGVEDVSTIALSLTCDRQVVDVAQGGRFLRLLAEKIEHVEYEVILRS